MRLFLLLIVAIIGITNAFNFFALSPLDKLQKISASGNATHAHNVCTFPMMFEEIAASGVTYSTHGDVYAFSVADEAEFVATNMDCKVEHSLQFPHAIGEVHYWAETGKVYAIVDNPSKECLDIGAIDVKTGALTRLLSLPPDYGYVLGSSALDAHAGLFVTLFCPAESDTQQLVSVDLRTGHVAFNVSVPERFAFELAAALSDGSSKLVGMTDLRNVTLLDYQNGKTEVIASMHEGFYRIFDTQWLSANGDEYWFISAPSASSQSQHNKQVVRYGQSSQRRAAQKWRDSDVSTPCLLAHVNVPTKRLRAVYTVDVSAEMVPSFWHGDDQ